MNKFPLLLLCFTFIAVLISPSMVYAVTPTSTKGIITFTSNTATDATWEELKKCTQLKEVTPDNDVAYIDVPDDLVANSHLVKFSYFESSSAGVGGASFSSRIVYYSCPAEILAKAQAASQASTQSSTYKLLTNAFSWLIDTINAVLTWVLGLAGYLLIVMIGQGKFITSDIVRQAWPFVQGIANLGFIFALLYIALATTLRLESVTTSIQKLLPKLLIAALLVNFSLVIGGLLIDTSRLLMAVEIRLLGNGLDYENFTKKLTEKSNQVGATLAAISNVDTNNASALILKMIQSSLFLGLLTAAILLIAANLFIRYVVLLILLILSPLAYLALALPNTSKYASQWWGMFIKWVLYGPIVLFFLIIVTRVQNVDVQLAADATLNKPFIAFFNQFIHFAIIIALFFVGNSVAKKVAGVGSDAVLGFAKKNPRAALIAGASLGSGGLLGGVAAAALTSRNARDFYQDTKSNVAKRARSNELFGKDTTLSKAAQFIAGPERDKEGKLKEGQESWGSRLADRLPVSTSTDGRNAAKAVSSLPNPDLLERPIPPKPLKRGATQEETRKFDDAQEKYLKDKEAYDESRLKIEAEYNVKELAPAKLLKKTTANALSKDQIGQIMKHGSDAQREALVTHKEVVSKMGDDIKGLITTGKIGNDTLKKKLDSRLRDLANKS